MNAYPKLQSRARQKQAESAPARLSYRISEFCQATGIGRSRLYEEIAAGRLRTVKFGRSTLVMAEDATAFLANLRGAA
jgi:excisionase family DNA binding protein